MTSKVNLNHVLSTRVDSSITHPYLLKGIFRILRTWSLLFFVSFLSFSLTVLIVRSRNHFEDFSVFSIRWQNWKLFRFVFKFPFITQKRQYSIMVVWFSNCELHGSYRLFVSVVRGSMFRILHIGTTKSMKLCFKIMFIGVLTKKAQFRMYNSPI